MPPRRSPANELPYFGSGVVLLATEPAAQWASASVRVRRIRNRGRVSHDSGACRPIHLASCCPVSGISCGRMSWSHPAGRRLESELDRIGRGGLATSTEKRLRELTRWGGFSSFLDAPDFSVGESVGIHPVCPTTDPRETCLSPWLSGNCEDESCAVLCNARPPGWFQQLARAICA